jgi:hypothetical protein
MADQTNRRTDAAGNIINPDPGATGTAGIVNNQGGQTGSAGNILNESGNVINPASQPVETESARLARVNRVNARPGVVTNPATGNAYPDDLRPGLNAPAVVNNRLVGLPLHELPINPATGKPTKLGKDAEGNVINAFTGKPLDTDRLSGLPLHPDTLKPMYPEPHATPGDEEQIKKLMNSLGAITDVGSLAQILTIVTSRCKTYKVHPDVITTAFKNAGVK